MISSIAPTEPYRSPQSMYGVLDGEKATGVSFLAEKAEDSAFLAENPTAV